MEFLVTSESTDSPQKSLPTQLSQQWQTRVRYCPMKRLPARTSLNNIEEVLVAWGRAGDPSRQNEPSQQFRDSFIVALVGDSAPSSPVGWPLRLDLRDDFESASAVTKAQWRHANRMKAPKSAKEMNTLAADVPPRRWLEVGEHRRHLR